MSAAASATQPPVPAASSPSAQPSSASTPPASDSPAQTVAVVAPAAAAPTSPAAPTSSTDYVRCPCLSALPGRACPRCLSSHWLRRCAPCHGSGHIYANRRYSAGGQQPTSEKHGACNGSGWLACTREEAMPLENSWLDEQAAAKRAADKLASSFTGAGSR